MSTGSPVAVGPALHVVEHAPFAGLGDHDAVGAQLRRRAHELAAEGLGVGGVVERDVADPDAVGAQLGREVAHRGQDEGDLLLVVRDVGGLGHHLDHQHRVAPGVEVLQRGDLPVELVAQDEAEGAGHEAVAAGGRSLRWRR